MALGWALIFSAVLGTADTIVLLPFIGVVGDVGWVRLTDLLATETQAGVGTRMALGMALNNLGAAAGGAIGGMLLAVGGSHGLAVGPRLFGLVSVPLVWRSQTATRRACG